MKPDWYGFRDGFVGVWRETLRNMMPSFGYYTGKHLAQLTVLVACVMAAMLICWALYLWVMAPFIPL
jgi:hypothetical protein